MAPDSAKTYAKWHGTLKVSKGSELLVLRQPALDLLHEPSDPRNNFKCDCTLHILPQLKDARPTHSSQFGWRSIGFGYFPSHAVHLLLQKPSLERHLPHFPKRFVTVSQQKFAEFPDSRLTLIVSNIVCIEEHRLHQPRL
jgi:hypothetical protein